MKFLSIMLMILIFMVASGCSEEKTQPTTQTVNVNDPLYRSPEQIEADKKFLSVPEKQEKTKSHSLKF